MREGLAGMPAAVGGAQQQQVILAAPSVPVVVAEPAPGAGYATDHGKQYRQWSWEGRLHPVPKDWVFPLAQLTCEQLWRRWFFGEADRHIAPYRHLRSFDVGRKMSSYLAQAANVINALEVLSVGVVSANNRAVAARIAAHSTPQIECMNLFTDAYQFLTEGLIPSFDPQP
jgi:hypothetical protein